MGDKKKMKEFVAYAYLWGLYADKEGRKQLWKDFEANMGFLYDQMEEIQEKATEAQKEAWNKFFPKLMEMQDQYASMGWYADKGERKKMRKDFEANLEAFYEQLEEIQDSADKAQKEAWSNFVPKLTKMQDNFVSSLPEEMPTPPGTPGGAVNRKEFMDEVKEFQEKAN
jgi:uncharacterized protein YicC (UPF0701 family)